MEGKLSVNEAAVADRLTMHTMLNDSASLYIEKYFGGRECISMEAEKGSYVIWDSNNTSGGPDQSGNTTRDSYIGLGHELAHIQDIWNGTINTGTWQGSTPNGEIKKIPKAEIYATHIENQIRAENGVPLRVSYGKDPDNNPDLSTRIIQAGTSQSIYYQQNGTTNYNLLKKGQIPFKYNNQ